ncbi:ABC1 kinase family protein [Luteimonas terrae]|uniref:Unusual protein kinase regulating ubiquinone biosynthesis (AarF/ABC1/UbiB family) n=1 Tax=Luteimonas terrae TaxID=1530191 RepID=A0ABU1XVQ8_9GAMM|nr:AarF/UbiB family protein [Luteimonas terrae]MDR7192849.1 putative unusual protein kinase regulating ubiquinone biosynthesis (AarF/ABC1/UbiB family) [Luteimonas terrae]
MTDTSRALARHAQILRFLMKYRSAGVLSGLEFDPATADAAPEGEPGKPEAFVDDLEALGPTFIKIGQALSTRPDMVPPAYLVALERMQDNVAPLPFEVIHEAIEDALGVRISKIFESFDEKPLGSASLAQVHRATLRDGRKVAVKVQRPGITEQIRDDLDTLARLAGGVDRVTEVGRRIRFADWVHEFRRTLLAELDYRIEAENLDRFDAHFVAYPALFVPKPIWDLTRARVLTMELVEGTKVTDITGLQRTERDMAPLATELLHGYLDQVFVHGEIHADPHPGNLLFTRDGRLALLDLGMVAHVPPRTRERLLKLLFAAVDGRGEQVAAEGIAMGTRLEDFDEGRYYRDVGQLVARYAAQSGATGQTEGRLMLDLVRLATACGLRTAPEMSLLGKTLLHLESVVQALDPDLDMKRVVEDHLNNMMRQRLRKSLSPANLASELMDMQELVRDAPRKVSNVLSLLSENRLRVRLTGLEESHLLESLHKIANRIAAGIVTAALILASAMMMDNPGGPRLFGYPAIALLLFLTGAGLGIAIVLSALLGDRRAKPNEERGPN